MAVPVGSEAKMEPARPQRGAMQHLAPGRDLEGAALVLVGGRSIIREAHNPQAART